MQLSPVLWYRKPRRHDEVWPPQLPPPLPPGAGRWAAEPTLFSSCLLALPHKEPYTVLPSLRSTIRDNKTHPSNLQMSGKSFPTHKAEGTCWIGGAPSWSAIWKQECDQTEGLPINCLSGGNETCEQLGCSSRRNGPAVPQPSWSFLKTIIGCKYL